MATTRFTSKNCRWLLLLLLLVIPLIVVEAITICSYFTFSANSHSN